MQIPLGAITAALPLAGAFLLPSLAHAASGADGCAVLGFFNAQARAVCEQAARSGQGTQAQQYGPAQPPPTYGQPPATYGQPPAQAYGAPPPAAYSPPSPPQPGFSRVSVVGNLFVDVRGTYPQGYGGKWIGVGAQTSVPVSQTWYVNRGEQRSTIHQPIILASDSSGRAQFGFMVRGVTCYGDITGVDGPVVITEAPQTFRLSNLHMLTPNWVAGCPITNTMNNFSGRVTLSADGAGDINIQSAVNVFNAQGAQQFLWELQGVQMTNAVTPAVAVADVEQKKMAAAQAAAAEAARAKRLARVLTPMEAKLEEVIQEDSAAWIINRYDAKSVDDVKIVTPTKEDRVKYGLPSGIQVLWGKFTQNGGRPSFVKVGLRNGQVFCVKFADDSDCRPVGQPASLARTAAIFSALASSGGGDSSPTGASETARFQSWSRRNDADFQQYHASPGQ